MTLDGNTEIARHVLPDGRTLVWRDEGSPYDNVLHIYLFATDGHLADALSGRRFYYQHSVLSYGRSERLRFHLFRKRENVSSHSRPGTKVANAVSSAIGLSLQIAAHAPSSLGQCTERISHPPVRYDEPMLEASYKGSFRESDSEVRNPSPSEIPWRGAGMPFVMGWACSLTTRCRCEIVGA